MAGLLDNGTDDDALEEYRRRLQTLPMFDERQMSVDDLRYQRALTALREQTLTAARPAQLPGALQELGGMVPGSPPGPGGAASSYGSPPSGLLSPTEGSNPAGTLVSSPAPRTDFYGRLTGPASGNIEDRRGDFGWQNVARWLASQGAPRGSLDQGGL